MSLYFFFANTPTFSFFLRYVRITPVLISYYFYFQIWPNGCQPYTPQTEAPQWPSYNSPSQKLPLISVIWFSCLVSVTALYLSFVAWIVSYQFIMWTWKNHILLPDFDYSLFAFVKFPWFWKINFWEDFHRTCRYTHGFLIELNLFYGPLHYYFSIML